MLLGRGGARGTKIVNKHFVNKLAFPMFRILNSIFFRWWVHLRRTNCTLAKAASVPARRQSETHGPRLFGFIFRRCPPSQIFFPSFRARFSTVAAAICTTPGKIATFNLEAPRCAISSAKKITSETRFFSAMKRVK